MNRNRDLEQNFPPSYEEAIQNPFVGKQPNHTLEMTTIASAERQTNEVNAISSESQDSACCVFTASCGFRLLANTMPLCVLGVVFYAMNCTYYGDEFVTGQFPLICTLWGFLGVICMVANFTRGTDEDDEDGPSCGAYIAFLAYLFILVGGGFLVRADVFSLGTNSSIADQRD